MRLSMLLTLALIVSACSHSVTAPTPQALPNPAPSQITYTINVPDVTLALQLQAAFPNGVEIAPIEAQQQWDFTNTYGGSPNVYYGETAPWQGYDCAGNPIPVSEYMNTGIVVAPRTVADLETFTSRDWPNIGLTAGVTYEWLGRFAYARAETFIIGLSVCK